MPTGPSKSADRQRLSISLKRDERKFSSECFANSETTALHLNSRIVSRSYINLRVPEKLLTLKFTLPRCTSQYLYNLPDKSQLLHRKHLKTSVCKPYPVKLKFPIYFIAHAFQDYPLPHINLHKSLLPKHLPQHLLIRKDMNKFLIQLPFPLTLKKALSNRFLAKITFVFTQCSFYKKKQRNQLWEQPLKKPSNGLTLSTFISAQRNWFYTILDNAALCKEMIKKEWLLAKHINSERIRQYKMQFITAEKKRNTELKLGLPISFLLYFCMFMPNTHTAFLMQLLLLHGTWFSLLYSKRHGIYTKR